MHGFLSFLLCFRCFPQMWRGARNCRRNRQSNESRIAKIESHNRRGDRDLFWFELTTNVAQSTKKYPMRLQSMLKSTQAVYKNVFSVLKNVFNFIKTFLSILWTKHFFKKYVWVATHYYLKHVSSSRAKCLYFWCLIALDWKWIVFFDQKHVYPD